MYLYQPCLVTMALYAWAFEPTNNKDRWARIMCPLVVLAVSKWELFCGYFRLYPAALLLTAALFVGRVRTCAWAEVLTSSLLGGLFCWKASDAWPLSPGLMLMNAALLSATVVFLCRKREDRLMAISMGSLIFELFFCLREYLLFSFCVVRIGSRDALSLAATTLCLYFVFERGYAYVIGRKKGRVSMGN